jgi:transcriptional regulator with GAF, ATPase, and Fis domain
VDFQSASAGEQFSRELDCLPVARCSTIAAVERGTAGESPRFPCIGRGVMSSTTTAGLRQPIEPFFVGQVPAVKTALNLVARIAATRASVLITGETGTGKDVIARLLHARSDRADRPFFAVNCGALADSLIESELFGHARGAFTGANAQRAGKFAAAHGGTLFFDEVTSMSPHTQSALLRVLQSGEYCPIGSEQTMVCDVRVIAAANRELRELVSAGSFRADLFYRLNIVRIHLPPLRERREDLAMLIDHFLRVFADRYDRGAMQLDPVSRRQLHDYDYPGNVRELETIIHRATLLADGPVVSVEGLLDPASAPAAACAPSAPLGSFHRDKARMVEKFERDYLVAAMRRSRGVVTEAAKAAGLSERNFHLKLRKYGLGRHTLPETDARVG